MVQLALKCILQFKRLLFQLFDALAFGKEFHLRERILQVERLKYLQTIG